jgi:hypothetical protein
MTSRPIKMAVVILLGFLLAWQGVFASSARIGTTEQVAKKSCCCTGCDNKSCATPACCVKPSSPSAPADPASLPSTSQNEFHALAVSAVSVLALPARPARELPACPASSALVTTVPLFQRDCAWLI